MRRERGGATWRHPLYIRGQEKEQASFPKTRITSGSHRSKETAVMKVLALAVLLLAIGSLEAGVVKREVPSAQEFSDIFQSWFETLKTSAQDLAQKVQNGEIQAQAGQLLEQTKSQTDPIKVEIEKIFAKLYDAGKKLSAS